MNINTIPRIVTYWVVFVLLAFLLYREYTYVHPYYVGYGMLGPDWEYTSTCTFSWWMVLAGSAVLALPFLRKRQLIGVAGLLLMAAVLIRPGVHYRFPREQATDFYRSRAGALEGLIQRYGSDRDTTITHGAIQALSFDELNIHDGTYFFYLYDPDLPGKGLCYDPDGRLPRENYGRSMSYKKLARHWYEFHSM